MVQEEKEIQTAGQEMREYRLHKGTQTEKTVKANTDTLERMESETETAIKILLGEEK